jgi:hypothetical protein
LFLIWLQAPGTRLGDEETFSSTPQRPPYEGLITGLIRRNCKIYFLDTAVQINPIVNPAAGHFQGFLKDFFSLDDGLPLALGYNRANK